tara:strand:- start:48 stop:554 length:507 start_codon:yes stop_codon:yes gene_type:complete
MLKEGFLILSFNRLVILFFSIVVLASCGFQPLYDNNSLSGFVVNTPGVQNESSRIIYKGLTNVLSSSATSENYIIDFVIDEQSEDIDIREDEKVLRKNIVISVKFYVKKEKDDKEVFSGESLISSAYNRVAEPYANYVNEQDTRNRILILIVQDIRRQLALFRKNQVK